MLNVDQTQFMHTLLRIHVIHNPIEKHLNCAFNRISLVSENLSFNKWSSFQKQHENFFWFRSFFLNKKNEMVNDLKLKTENASKQKWLINKFSNKCIGSSNWHKWAYFACKKYKLTTHGDVVVVVFCMWFVISSLLYFVFGP